MAEIAEQQVAGFKIYCMKCRARTATMEDITLKRNIGNRYYVIGNCVHCGSGKSKPIEVLADVEYPGIKILGKNMANALLGIVTMKAYEDKITFFIDNEEDLIEYVNSDIHESKRFPHDPDNRLTRISPRLYIAGLTKQKNK